MCVCVCVEGSQCSQDDYMYNVYMTDQITWCQKTDVQSCTAVSGWLAVIRR